MSDRVFILKVDTITGYDGDIAWFPEPLFVTVFAKNGSAAIRGAYEQLRAEARELGANAVLSVNHRDFAEFDNHKKQYKIRAVGQPVYLDPPLLDAKEILRGLSEQGL